MIITIEFLEKWNFDKLLPFDVRTPNIRSKYEKFKKKLNNSSISIDTYIYNKYLKNDMYKIIENNFPYNIDNNMYHYVLWINPKCFKIINDKKITDIICDKMKKLNCNEYFCFENQNGSKSVLKIPHYQIFFRRC